MPATYGRRPRDLRRKRDVLAYAKQCMEIWAAWQAGADERGWPSESVEGRAMQSAKTGTNTKGQAAYRGRVVIAEDEDGNPVKTVAKDPPPYPKETRAAARSRLPNIDHARLGPAINRHLLDLHELGGAEAAKVLRMHHGAPGEPVQARASALGMSIRTYWYRYSQGLAWLAGRLSVT